jgi:hypothetical protein
MGLLEGRAEATSGDFNGANADQMRVWSRFSGRLTKRQISIHLNEHLRQITVCAALCAFISTNAAEFNAVNVAVSLLKLFQLPSTPADKER